MSSEDKGKSAKSSKTADPAISSDDSALTQKKGSEKKVQKDNAQKDGSQKEGATKPYPAPALRRSYTVNVLSTELLKLPGEKAFTVRYSLYSVDHAPKWAWNYFR
jgi:hypothetical protein